MSTRSENFIMAHDMAWEDLGGGLQRQILGFDGQLMLVKIKFEVGSIGYIHQHYHSQSSYVVSGKFEVEIKGEKKILVAGDGFYTEPDVPHGVVCLEAGVLIDAFSPVRADFLKK